MESLEKEGPGGILETMREAGRLWWIVELVIGILWIIAALIILQYNSASMSAVGIIIGIMFLVAGAQQFFIAALSADWAWLWILFGVLFMGAGIVALVYPKDTFTAAADIVGFLVVLFGFFLMFESFVMKDSDELWWLNLVSGILLIILGFWAAGQFFITKAYTLLVFVGIWALFKGFSDIFMAFRVRRIGKDIGAL